MNTSRGFDGITPLLYAALYGHLRVARLLLERGANVNAASTDDECTALMYASEGGHLGIVQLLLASGANKDAVNAQGQTALAMASTPEIKYVLK